MYTIDELSELSREDLYLMINRQKQRIDCLTTDLMRFKSHLKLFYKYFEEIDENCETTEGIKDLIKEIETVLRVNDKDVLVMVKKWKTELKDFNLEEYLASEECDKNKVFKSDENGNHLKINFKSECSPNGSTIVNDIKPNVNHQNIETNNLTETSDISEESDEEYSPLKRLPLKSLIKKNLKPLRCRGRKIASKGLKKKRKRVHKEINITAKDDNIVDVNDVDDVNSKTKKKNSFVCNFKECKKTFRSNFALNRHKSVEHCAKQLKPSYHCGSENCKKVFLSKQSLNAHKKVHRKIIKCNIPGCDYKTKYNTHFLRHQYRVHSPQKQPIKSSSLSSSDDKEEPRNLSQSFRCQVNNCNMSFPNGAVLAKHQEIAHKQVANTHDNQFFCIRNGCDFTSNDIHEREVHLRSHLSGTETKTNHRPTSGKASLNITF